VNTVMNRAQDIDEWWVIVEITLRIVTSGRFCERCDKSWYSIEEVNSCLAE